MLKARAPLEHQPAENVFISHAVAGISAWLAGIVRVNKTFADVFRKTQRIAQLVIERAHRNAVPSHAARNAICGNIQAFNKDRRDVALCSHFYLLSASGSFSLPCGLDFNSIGVLSSSFRPSSVRTASRAEIRTACSSAP